MKKENKFNREKEEYEKKVLEVFKYGQYINIVLGVVSTIWLSWWSIAVFGLLYLICYKNYESAAVSDMRYYAYIAASSIQIIFCTVCIL